MSENDPEPQVACTLTAQKKADRLKNHWSTLSEKHVDSKEQEFGYTHSFDGTDETLVALATFVSNEHECCAFAEYTIEIAPPYDETRLTITGPDGTKDMFGENFIEALRNGQ